MVDLLGKFDLLALITAANQPNIKTEPSEILI